MIAGNVFCSFLKVPIFQNESFMIDLWSLLITIYDVMLKTRVGVCVCELLSCVQFCVTLWTVAQPGSSVHGILQARILEWVSIPFSGDLPQPGSKPGSLNDALALFIGNKV